MGHLGREEMRGTSRKISEVIDLSGMSTSLQHRGGLIEGRRTVCPVLGKLYEGIG